MDRGTVKTNEQSVVNTAEKKNVLNGDTVVSKLVYFDNLKVSNNGSLFSKDFPEVITHEQLVLIQEQKPKIKLDADTMKNKESYYLNASKTKEYTKDKDGVPLAPKDYWKQAYYYPKGVNSLDFVL